MGKQDLYCFLAAACKSTSILKYWGGMGREMGWRFKREGIFVYLWLTHVEVWQKTAKFIKSNLSFN